MSKRIRIAWHPMQQHVQRLLYTEQSPADWDRMRQTGLPLEERIICKMRWAWLPDWVGRLCPALTVLVMEIRFAEVAQDE
jgi:hypothetical protein